MVALPKEMDLTEINGKQVNRGRSPKAKFRVFGEELIEKVVKSSGNTGRVYLPPSWVGKHVKIIRTD
jgi:putative transposon-encoded protein